jgi:hypothetical protein
VPFCLACPPDPLAAAHRYVVETAPALGPTSGSGLSPASTGRRGDRRWASYPTRNHGASWRTADLVNDQQWDERQSFELGFELALAFGLAEPCDPLGRRCKQHSLPSEAGLDPESGGDVT